jgi:hypothetical protein
MHKWMENNGAYSITTLRQHLADERDRLADTKRPWFERRPGWLLERSERTFHVETMHVRLTLLIAFASADLVVIASSFDGLHLLQLGKRPRPSYERQ